MTQIQWLLIGGEGHGKTLWIKAGNCVNFPAKHGAETQQYQGSDYVIDGKIYRVGLHNTTPEERSEIPPLIAATKLAPLGAV